MEFRKIKGNNNCEDVIKLYIDSFPEAERVPFDDLFTGVFAPFEFVCLYDGDKIVGMLHYNNADNFVHCNYLAVSKEYQDQGNGSRILSWVKENYPGKSLVVDIEELDDTADNRENRIRRKSFYERNGFVQGDYVFDWEGVFMTYMHCGDVDAEEFMSYIQIVFPTIHNVRKRKKD